MIVHGGNKMHLRTQAIVLNKEQKTQRDMKELNKAYEGNLEKRKSIESIIKVKIQQKYPTDHVFKSKILQTEKPSILPTNMKL